MRKALSIDFDLQPIVTSALSKIRALPIAQSAYETYMIELTARVPELIINGATQSQVNTLINTINRKHYTSIQNYFYKQIGGKTIDFEDIKKFDSYGITTEKRVTTSIKRSFKTTKIKANLLQRKVQSKLITDIEAKEAFIDTFVKDFANSISSSLGIDSSRLIKTETYKTKQLLSDLKHKGQKCQWQLGPTQNHCPICLGHHGNIYDGPEDAPIRPVHPNCRCFLKYL